MSKTAEQNRPITVPVWGAATSLGGGGLGLPKPKPSYVPDHLRWENEDRQLMNSIWRRTGHVLRHDDLSHEIT